MTDLPDNTNETHSTKTESTPLDSSSSIHTSQDASPAHASTVSKSNSPNATPYPTDDSKKKVNWLWLLPLLIATLVIGLMAGRWWGQKQVTEAAAGEATVVPQIATATGITEVETQSSDKPVLTVETVDPSQSVVTNDLTAEGTISPKKTATVNGKVNGVAIDQVLVEEGDRVKKGQVLAVFDTDAMSQQVIQAQAEFAEAKTRYDLAKTDAERILPLLDINAISQQEADRYVATAKQAAASVAASQARLNNQNLNMNNAQVTAPVSGIISNKTANVGSVPGGEPLFTIIQNGELEWQAQVNPEKVGKINVGTPVEVSLPNNQIVMGKVSRIAPTAEQGSRQITIYAALANHPNARAGMYQQGKFKLKQQSAMTLPVSAIVTEDGYDYVMQAKAVKDDNRNTIYRINRIKVKLGERIEDKVVLLEPLSSTGGIVRQGGSFLNDGDVVRVVDATQTQ